MRGEGHIRVKLNILNVEGVQYTEYSILYCRYSTVFYTVGTVLYCRILYLQCVLYISVLVFRKITFFNGLLQYIFKKLIIMISCIAFREIFAKVSILCFAKFSHNSRTIDNFAT